MLAHNTIDQVACNQVNFISHRFSDQEAQRQGAKKFYEEWLPHRRFFQNVLSWDGQCKHTPSSLFYNGIDPICGCFILVIKRPPKIPTS